MSHTLAPVICLVFSFVVLAFGAPHAVTTNPSAGLVADASFASAVVASDLSGSWSGIGETDKAGWTIKLVQQGNTLTAPSTRDPRVPTSLNITLYGGYGYGEGALWSLTDGSFCAFTDVVLDAVDTAFLKITWFPRSTLGKCLPFSGSLTKYTRPY